MYESIAFLLPGLDMKSIEYRIFWLEIHGPEWFEGIIMKLDRSLIGVIGISIVLSTVISLFLVIEQTDEGVTILSNDFPTRPFDQERRFSYALSMMARRPLEEVSVRYISLDVIEVENTTTESTHEETILINLPRIDALMEEANSLDFTGGVEIWEGRVEWTNTTAHRTHELDMYMYDFTDMMMSIAPGKAGVDATSTFVVWINQTNNSIFRYFEGGPFQFNGSLIIEDLVVTQNYESTRYSTEGKPGTVEDPLPIGLAPMDGTVRFEDVEKDDRLSIDFTLTSPARLLFIRVYVNGGMKALLSASDATAILQ